METGAGQTARKVRVANVVQSSIRKGESKMSRRCELTGVGPVSGNQVSHSNIKTRTRWLPNIKDKRYSSQEAGQTLSLRLTTRAIRTIDKQGGITQAIRLAKIENLSERLKKLRTLLANSGAPEANHPAARARVNKASRGRPEG